jgi:ubiquinone/menaquinone biosynthesis C-methylase UbiE
MKQNTDTLVRLTNYFDSIAERWDRWQEHNRYYHKNVKHLLQFLIPQHTSVLELGCATGDLLNAVQPSIGVGVDISSKMVHIAQKKYPHYTFHNMNAEQLSLEQKFDYVVMTFNKRWKNRTL